MAGLYWFGQLWPNLAAFNMELKRRGIKPRVFHAKHPQVGGIFDGSVKQGRIRATGAGTGGAAGSSTTETTTSSSSTTTGGGTVGDTSLTDSPIPGIAQYGTIMAKALDAYNTALADTETNRSNQLRQLGFDTAGHVQGLNPYGAYQLNRKVAGQETEQLLEEAAARGFGGQLGGLGGEMVKDNTFERGLGMAQILQQAEGVNTQAERDKLDLVQQRDEAYRESQLGAAQQAIDERLFNKGPVPASSTTTSSSTAGAASNAAKLAKKNAKKGQRPTYWDKRSKSWRKMVKNNKGIWVIPKGAR